MRPPPALEVDEVRLAVLHHHVAALEVAVHERVAVRPQQHGGQPLEVVLQAVFREFQTRGFEETVFEIIQIPHHRARVELRQRVARREVEAPRPHDLHFGQALQGAAQQGRLLLAIRAGAAAGGQAVEQRGVAQVLLQVIHIVRAAGQHLRHGQPGPVEVPRHGDEGAVFLYGRAFHADDGHAPARQAEIAAVRPGGGQRLHALRHRAGELLEQGF